ncbi:hypothetical protein SAY87_006482 [Trapa incisa]|uniref:Uncharacterized protein n=1 Tax=Trapa incisa TaxID=236973 RepID=A0AAN7K2F7_9MYRT|nr:hypothetical protein SAY87_006482 [Trapa incisa]
MLSFSSPAAGPEGGQDSNGGGGNAQADARNGVSAGRVEREDGKSVVEDILRRSTVRNLMSRATLWARVLEAAICTSSFAVMAADKTKGWSGDSFDRYREYRFCGLLYSGFQILSSSPATTRVDVWVTSWGKDQFTHMASASIGLDILSIPCLRIQLSSLGLQPVDPGFYMISLAVPCENAHLTEIMGQDIVISRYPSVRKIKQQFHEECEYGNRPYAVLGFLSL